MKLTLLS